MKLDSRQLALMSMLIALNLAIGGLVHVLKLPVFLDAIGTVLGVVLLGLLPGMIIGVASFALAAVVLNPVYIWFIGTQAVIAITVYLAASKLGAFKTWQRAAATGIALGVIAGIASAPVIVGVFGGVSGSGRDLITVALMKTGEQIFKAVLLSGAASEPIDKLLQVMAAYFVLHALPKSVLIPFRNPVLERNGLI